MKNPLLMELITRAAAGDRQAFELLYQQTIDSILLQAKQLSNNVQDAEDIAHNTVLTLFQKIGTLRDPALFWVWLHRIIVNESNMMLRKKYIRRQRVLTVDDPDLLETMEHTEFLTQEYLENEEMRDALLAAVENLPLKYRQPLILFYFDGLTSGEIAMITGINSSTVRNHIEKARHLLTREMEKKFGPIEVPVSALTGMPLLRLALQYDAEQILPNSLRDSFFKDCERMLDAIKEQKHTVSPVKHALPLRQMTMIIGCFAAMTVIFLAFSSRLPGPFAPLPAISEVPQLSEATAGSGALDIKKPDDSGKFAGNGGAKAENGSMEMLLYGRVSLAEMEPAEKKIPDDMNRVQIALFDNDTEIARTTVLNTGEYRFDPIEIPSDSAYSVAVFLPSGSYLAFGSANPNGTAVLFPDAKVEQDFVLIYGVSPVATATLYGNDCDCGHVNPLRAAFFTNSLDGILKWQITASGSDEVLFSGTGFQITAPFAELEQCGADGVYTIRYEFINVAGEKQTRQIEFRIFSGPIALNQFG